MSYLSVYADKDDPRGKTRAEIVAANLDSKYTTRNKYDRTVILGGVVTGAELHRYFAKYTTVANLPDTAVFNGNGLGGAMPIYHLTTDDPSYLMESQP